MFQITKKPPKHHIFSGFTGMDLSALNSNIFQKIVKTKYKPFKTKNNISPTEIESQGIIEVKQLHQQQKRLTEREIASLLKCFLRLIDLLLFLGLRDMVFKDLDRLSFPNLLRSSIVLLSSRPKSKASF